MFWQSCKPFWSLWLLNASLNLICASKIFCYFGNLAKRFTYIFGSSLLWVLLICSLVMSLWPRFYFSYECMHVEMSMIVFGLVPLSIEHSHKTSLLINLVLLRIKIKLFHFSCSAQRLHDLGDESKSLPLWRQVRHLHLIYTFWSWLKCKCYIIAYSFNPE